MPISTINRIKGIEYERLVAEYYRSLGYIVIWNGECGDKKKSDGGVDVIAFKAIPAYLGLNLQLSLLDNTSSVDNTITIDTEILLIQCKNYQSSKISEDEIKKYINFHKDFKQLRLKSANATIKSILAVANNCIDYAVFNKYKNHKDIEIRHLEISLDGECVTLKEYNKSNK